MILLGYQGIGKSTMAKKNKDLSVIDLESSCYTWGSRKLEDWHKAYADNALHLSRQGYTVFIATHAPVREWIGGHNTTFPLGVQIDGMYEEQVAVVVPDTSLKDEWVAKLRKRYEATKLMKDYCAWMNADDRFVDNINEIMADAEKYSWGTIIIPSLEYDLRKLISEKYVIDRLDLECVEY